MKQVLNDIQSTHTPREIRRLGNFNPDNPTRTRPLRMSFDSRKARDDVLSSFIKTRKRMDNNKDEEANNGETPLVSSIAMRKDLTPLERQQEDAMYAEMRSKKEESQKSGDVNARWVRRNGQIVNVGKYPKGAGADVAEV